MIRTQPVSSQRRTIETSARQRVAAVLGLFALGFLMGHVHPVVEIESDPFGFGAPTVSNDTAHHEHSSHAIFDTTACVACRSFGEKTIPPSRTARLDSFEPRAGVLPDETNAAPRAPFAGLPATRAPPSA